MTKSLFLIIKLADEISKDLINGKDVTEKIKVLNTWLEEYKQQYEFTLVLK